MKPLSFFKHFNVFFLLEAHIVAYEKIEVFFLSWKNLCKGSYCFIEVLKYFWNRNFTSDYVYVLHLFLCIEKVEIST